MIDCSDIVSDPDLAQSFVVVRTRGTFALGGYLPSSICSIPFWGNIQKATEEQLDIVSEGERVTGAMQFASTQRMYHTWAEGLDCPSGLSDQIEWRGQCYKIVDVSPDVDYGFWKAIGVRQSGE